MAARKSAALKQAEQSIRDTGNYLGEIVFWSLFGADPTREEMAEAMTDAAIDLNFLPKGLSAQQAFTRATTVVRGKAEKPSSGTDETKRYIVRKVWEDTEEVVVALLESKHDRVSRKTAVEQPNCFRLDKITDSLTYETGLYAQEFANEFQHALSHYTHNHVREVILAMLQACEATCIRESGGVYFVPREITRDGQAINTGGLLDCVEQFLCDSRLGNCSFNRIAVAAGDTKTTKTIANIFETDIVSELDEIAKIVEDPDKVRQSTLNNRLNDVLEMKDKANMYTTVLKVEMKRVEERLAPVEEALREMLGLG